MLRRRAALLSLLMVPLLAGCTSAPPTPDITLPSSTTTGAPAASNITSLPWTLGESWDQRFYIGASDTEGLPIKAIVAEKGGKGEFHVATDNNETAALDAAFFFQTLGWFRPGAGGLTASEQGSYSWPWYRFPMAAGDVWQATMKNVDDLGAVYTVEVKANVTALAGGKFATELRSLDGGLIAKYDYDPALHWFSEFSLFDYRAPEPNPTEPRFRIVNSAHATGWNGTWYEATAALLLSKSFDQPAPPNVTQPDPSYTFPMAAEQDHLLAFPFAYAVAGAWATQVVAPDGRHYEVPAYGAPGGAGIADSLYVKGAAGDWRVISQGAGAFAAGGGILAYGIKETAHTSIVP